MSKSVSNFKINMIKCEDFNMDDMQEVNTILSKSQLIKSSDY